MAKNTLKTDKASDKPKKTGGVKNFGAKVKAVFTDPKFRVVTGIFLLLFSFYLLLALTSFFFTGGADYSRVVNQSLWELISDNEIKVDNWMGKFGAIIASKLVNKSFGLASYVFVFLSFLLGIKALFKVSLVNIGNAFKHSLLILIWLPVTCAYFLSRVQGGFLGGNYGTVMDRWLTSLVGSIGALLIIIFSAITYSVIVFNLSFDWLQNLFIRETKEEVPEDEELETEVAQNQLKDTPQVVDFDENEETEEEDEIAIEDIPEPILKEENQEEQTEEETPVTFEETNPQPEPEPKPETDETDGVAFEIETVEDTLDEENTSVTSEDIVEKYGEYDPTLDLPKFKFPPLELLENHGSSEISVNKDELETNKNKIVQTLNNYGIEIEKIKATIGPTVTLYEIVPAAGVRISKIKNLEDDIALSLAALGIRIIAPIPGKGTIGIEVPNQNPDIVSMRSIIGSDKFQHSKYDLPIGLGKTISNETFIADLAKMPHLLMAGATGQGKSVGLNAILVSLLYKKHPSQLKFVLVDPKKVELTLFSKIERHYLAKLPDSEDAIITDTTKVVHTLNSLCIEMDQRYELLKDAQVRNLREYNAKFTQRKLNPNEGHRFLPYIVLVVDEFADLIMTAGKEVETPIARLAQLARAIGIHLIIATQRPSVNIITGTIKANFPARIAFKVTSKIDSRTILDAPGADQLIGRGDMLLSTGSDMIRIQCAFVDTPEVEAITEFIGGQQGYSDAMHLPEFVDENAGDSVGGLDPSERDSMFEDAARIIVIHQQGSASLLQRKLKLGYNRAGRIIDQLEAAGIIGPFEGSKARQVLIQDEASLDRILNNNNEL